MRLLVNRMARHARYPVGSQFDILYQNSDKALYQAKRNGKDGFALFSNR